MEEQETAVAIAEIKKEIGSLKHRMDSAEEVVNVVHQLAQEMVALYICARRYFYVAFSGEITSCLILKVYNILTACSLRQ